MILTSLVLTFHTKGTTVHKVLGLLLVSIFVVFLWMLQTQFLFIYIVYILAFISAVLMLFLSVVLMLPISTLTSKNLLTDKHVTHGLVPFSLMLNFETLTTLTITIIVMYSLIIAIYTFSVCIYKLKAVNTNSSLEICIVTNHMASHNLTGLTVNAQYIYILVTHVLHWAINSFYLALENVYNIIYEIFTSKQKRYNYWVFVNFKHVYEIIIQTYLFVGVLGSLFAAFCAKQVLLTTENYSQLETMLGLSQIKALLYGSNSAFLIFSTVVLLVALLGAAVMTRNKR